MRPLVPASTLVLALAGCPYPTPRPPEPDPSPGPIAQTETASAAHASAAMSGHEAPAGHGAPASHGAHAAPGGHAQPGGHAAPGGHAQPDGHAAHGMPHRFEDAERWAKQFEDPARDAWQKPDAVIDSLALARDAHVADIGSGTGYFAVRLARKVPKGKVYAVDVEADMVRYLSARARREKLPNLESRLGAFEDPLLPAPVDVVLLVDTYHHIEGRVAYFRKLQDSVQANGRLVIVDFKLGDIPHGPPETHRIGPEALAKELAEAGWKQARLDEKLLPYQYVAVYEKAEKKPPAP